MYRFTLKNRLFLTLLLIISIIGIISAALAFLIVPVMLLSLAPNKNNFLYMLAGFFFVLVLSDNLLPYFKFAATLKMIYIVELTLIYLFLNRQERFNYSYLSPFLIFFILASLCIIDSPIYSTSVLKTLSYGLLLVVIPTVLIRLLHKNKLNILRLWILVGAIVYVIGILMWLFAPMLASPRGRFSGLLGNPNGMGIFSLMFFIYLFIVFYYYPSIFNQTEKYILFGLIILSLLLSASRGGIFATAIFFSFQYLYKKSKILAIASALLLAISYQNMESNFVEIAEEVGLEEYFRTETLEEGSGRVTAFEFAWSKIRENPYWGHGIGYTEALMKQYEEELSLEGHQGNVHNSYLTIWLDTGLFGLIAFVFGWGYWLFKAGRKSHFAMPLLLAVLLSTNVESWLAASLNPFTIQLVVILTLLTNNEFIYNSERNRGPVVYQPVQMAGR